MFPYKFRSESAYTCSIVLLYDDKYNGVSVNIWFLEGILKSPPIFIVTIRVKKSIVLKTISEITCFICTMVPPGEIYIFEALSRRT